jgi:hypothetical protein
MRVDQGIDGIMAPIGPEDAAVADRLARLFMLAVHDAAIVSCGRPVNLGDFSDPPPGAMLVQRTQAPNPTSWNLRFCRGTLATKAQRR